MLSQQKPLAQAATGRDLRDKPALREQMCRSYMTVVQEVLRTTPAYTNPGFMRKPERLPNGVPFRYVSWPALASQCVTVSFQIRDEDLARVEALDDRMAMRAGSTSARVYRDLKIMRVEFTLPETQWLDVPLSGLPHHQKDQACVGLRTLGSPAVIDWNIPHKTVFGGTQTGKTTLLTDLVISLARAHTPEECQLIILNPKNEPSLNRFDHLPHLRVPLAVDYDDCVTTLRYCLGEMLARKGDRPRTKTRIVIIADEVADLVMAFPEIGVIITRLSQLAGGLRMNMVAASQAANPLVFGATGSLAKANFPSKIVFQLPRDQSYLATGQAGVRTDTLGRKGDGLAVVGNKVRRFRAAWPGERDFARLPRVETVPPLDESLVVGDAALGLDDSGDKYPSPEIVGDMLAYAIQMRPDNKPSASAKAIRQQFQGATSRATWIRKVAEQLRQRTEYWQEVKACRVEVLGEGEL
jgi:hypothetical protein